MSEYQDQLRRDRARRQLQYDYFTDDDWRGVAAGPTKAIGAGLRLLYRLVLAVERVGDVLENDR